MTDEELQRLEELCAAATAGPWIAKADEPDFMARLFVSRERILNTNDVVSVVDEICIARTSKPNAEFIAAARFALPYVLAEIRRLQEIASAQKETRAPTPA